MACELESTNGIKLVLNENITRIISVRSNNSVIDAYV